MNPLRAQIADMIETCDDDEEIEKGLVFLAKRAISTNSNIYAQVLFVMENHTGH